MRVRGTHYKQLAPSLQSKESRATQIFLKQSLQQPYVSYHLQLLFATGSLAAAAGSCSRAGHARLQLAQHLVDGEGGGLLARGELLEGGDHLGDVGLRVCVGLRVM